MFRMFRLLGVALLPHHNNATQVEWPRYNHSTMSYNPYSNSSCEVCMLLTSSLPCCLTTPLSDECDYGITTSITHKLWYMKPSVDIINITIDNVPAELLSDPSLAMINWWQYSSRHLMLQVAPYSLHYLWFGLLTPKVENVRLELPLCAQNDSYNDLLSALALGIISVCCFVSKCIYLLTCRH